MKRIISRIVCMILLFSLAQLAAAQTAPTTAPAHNFVRWEKEIHAMEERDKTAPPSKGGIVFAGASSIVRWKTLAKDFPDYPVINRGFGGSSIIDSTYYADRIILPLEPKKIFLRAGGNDIHGGKSPEEAFADYKDFVAKIRQNLPNCEIVFISQQPAPARWDEREKDKKLNELVAEYTKQTPGLMYIEAWDLGVHEDGTPREELFVADKLHFNEEGYKLLAERVRPYLPE